MFCARAGAKEVTAVDMSSIIEQVSGTNIIRCFRSVGFSGRVLRVSMILGARGNAACSLS